MPTREELKLLQALPLELKIMRTQQRIREWVNHYGEDGVCVSFSGGKDSTVLLHIVRSLYPNIRAVFSDTGLEYPSIRDFVKTIPNVDWVKPELTFREIVFQYGYPLFGKEIAETIRYARKIVPEMGEKSVGGGGGGRVSSSSATHYWGQGYAQGGRVAEKTIRHFQQRLLYTTELPKKENQRGFWTGKRTGVGRFSTNQSTYPLAKNFPF